MRWFHLFISSLFVLGFGQLIKAQNFVTIYDAESLEPLPFAHVQITELQSNQKTKSTTDESGVVEIPFSTEVQLIVSFIGYETITKNIIPRHNSTLYIFPYDVQVDEVVITGNPTETTSKESVYEVKVLDKETLESRAAVSLSDALVNELNVQISTDGVLGSTINLQGLGGNNVKIMIDGVPVIGRLNGNIDLSQINMNTIERIEIVEGPLSAMYGSNAIAGVINLITKQNQQEMISAFVNSYYESIGTYNIDAGIGFKKNKVFTQINAGRYFFDGWHPEAYDRNMDWNPKEQYFASINSVIRTESNWFHKLRGQYFQDRILNRFDPAGSIPVAFDEWYKTKRADFSYNVNGQINEHFHFNSTNAYNFYERIKNRYQKDLTNLTTSLVPDGEFEDNQDTTYAHQIMSRSFFTFKNPDKRIGVQFGYDFNTELGIGGRFKGENGDYAYMLDAALFVSVPIRISEKMHLQPAIRYAYNSSYKVLPTPSIQYKYQFHNNWLWRVNYGMGFRAPSLKELYLVFNDANHNVLGNTDLKPEQSQNVNSSLEFTKQKKLHQFQANLKYYYNYKYNAIALTPNENNEFQYLNIRNLSTMGIQLQTQYQFKNLSNNFGASLIGVANELFNEGNKNKHFFYPQIQWNVHYTIPKYDLSFNLLNKWQGPRTDFLLVEDPNGVEANEIEKIEIESYHMMDFNIQKSFWQRRIHLSAGIKNILNVSNINGGSSSEAHSSSTSTQIAAGRMYFVGLKFSTRP